MALFASRGWDFSSVQQKLCGILRGLRVVQGRCTVVGVSAGVD
jgi:hypothetical protein